MYYGNDEIISSKMKFEEILFYFKSKNLTWYPELSENILAKYTYDQDLKKYKNCEYPFAGKELTRKFVAEVNGKIFETEVTVFEKNGKFEIKITDGEKVVVRANKKTHTIRVKDLITQDFLNNLLVDYKEKCYKESAELFIERRKALTEEQKKSLEIVERTITFDKIQTTQERIEWLKKNNYKNAEKYGFHIKTGREGKLSVVDHKKKLVYISGYSSDD